MNLRLEYTSFQDFAGRLWPSLCEEGMWVESESPADIGELVDFEIMLADGFRLFHGTGQVISHGSGPAAAAAGSGMTIRFGQLDQPSRNLVRKVVSKHVGEGGEPFVLSSPKTKISVVGGDEEPPVAAAPEPRGRDLAPPFPEVAADRQWSEQSEPVLTSFLHPTGRSTELDTGELPAVDPPMVDFHVDPAAPVEPLEDLVERQFDGLLVSESDSPEEPAEEPATAQPPVAEVPPTVPDLSESLAAAHRALAETQAIEPLPPGADLSEAPDEVEPMASTFFPSTPDVEEVTVPEPEPDLEMHDLEAEAVSAPAGRKWWFWPAVAAASIGAGLLVARFMGVPLGGGEAGGSGSERAVAAVERPASPASDDDATSSPAVSAMSILRSEAAAEVAAGAERDATELEGRGEIAEDSAPSSVAVDSLLAEPVTAQPTVGELPAEPPIIEPSPVVPASTTPIAIGSLQLQRVTTRVEDGDSIVRLWLSGEVTPERLETVRVETGAPRQVLKILGVAGSVPAATVNIDLPHVEGLRFGVHQVDGVRRVHVVADLAGESVQLVGEPSVDEGGVELRFTQP